MKARIIAFMISQVLSLLTPELLKKAVDTFLDFVEDKVLGTASTVDDALVLPLTEMIRTTFDIPDNDDEEGAVAAVKTSID